MVAVSRRVSVNCRGSMVSDDWRHAIAPSVLLFERHEYSGDTVA